jgi:Tfp pilus assembly protein PilN
MAAFLSRFWLDAKNTDLNDEITQKQEVLVSSSDFENEFKDVQKKLEIFSELTKNEGAITQSLKTITSYLPQDMLLDSFTFTNNKINIEGISPSERSIQQLIVNLESNETFEDVSLLSIASGIKDPNLLEFSIAVTIK